MTISSDLEALRKQIDAIDGQLLELIAQRLQVVLKVGELKRRHGAKIYDPEREREVLERLTTNPPWPLERETVVRIFERLIDESRRIEQGHAR